MRWCPKCKQEYLPDARVCADCGIPLTNEKPANAVGEAAQQKWVLLQEADQYESMVIESLLRPHHIHVLKKCRGANGYLIATIGLPSLNILLYVPENLIEHARAIIATADISENRKIPQDSEEKERSNARDTRRKILIFLFLLGPAIVLLIWRIILRYLKVLNVI